MAAKFKFLLIYFLSWLTFFELMRVLFLLYHSDKTSKLPSSTIAGTFWYGLRMDVSVASYILIPVVLFVLLSLWIHYFRRLNIYKIYTAIILLVASIICLADLELYNAWGFRIDNTPLKFMTSPKEAFASISHLPLFWILLFFIIAFGLFYFCFNYVIRWIFFQQQNRQKPLTALTLLLTCGLLVVGIRGGFQQSPLNQSSVYFSNITYANHAAINASWNFLHSVTGKDNYTRNPYNYMDTAVAARELDSLYRGRSQADQWVRNIPGGRPANVIVILWESFTEKAIHLNVAGTAVTPRFNEYRKQGIFFSNCFASGDRTNKGIPAVFSGYPAMPNTTIIHSPGKSSKLNVLPQVFRRHGYQTPFFYGGETEFANIKSYLQHGGFEPIIGKDDFASRDMNSKWGAHDGVVMKRVLSDLGKTKEPFFAGWLTLSSHEPFEVPVPTIIAGKDVPHLFLNSLHYTDEVLGQFMDEARRQPWWEHTVIIIIGDHGHPLPETGKRADDFRTPMLWIGGAVTQPGLVVDRTVSQLDIARTLLGQFSFDRGQADPLGSTFRSDEQTAIDSGFHFPFSKDMADTATKSWAFFTFNNGFGYVDSSGVLVFDNVGKLVIQQDGRSGLPQQKAGEALMQQTFADFLRK